jgi:2-phospho-L-lactate guanylyltransferase (CobY/MobA/RfbA family)
MKSSLTLLAPAATGHYHGSTMQSLSDEERREVLGEVLMDELKAIHDYVKDIPIIKQDIRAINERLTAVESIVQMHEADIRYLRQRIA